MRGDFDKSVTDKYILSYIISDNGNPKLQATYNVEGYYLKIFTDIHTLSCVINDLKKYFQEIYSVQHDSFQFFFIISHFTLI